MRPFAHEGYARAVLPAPRAAVLCAAIACAALAMPAGADAAAPTCDVPSDFQLDMEAGQTISVPTPPCSDADGDPISIEVTQQPAHATLSPSGTAPLDTGRTLTANSAGDDSMAFRAVAAGEASPSYGVAIRITTPVVIVVVPNVTFAWDGDHNRAGQWFDRLAVTGIPKGSTVRVRCKGSSCPRHRQTFRVAGRHVRLRAFERKRLRPGTRLSVAVTHDDRVGVVKIMKIRRAKGPSIRTRCMAPGSSHRQRCP